MALNNQDKENLIVTRRLCVQDNRHNILQDVNLTVGREKIVTLIGPNGAGKSTLIQTILGLRRPTSGEVILAPKIRVGYMPQKIQVESLMPLMVSQFLSLAPRTKSINYSVVAQKLGIEALLEHPVQGISGGELQRVLLARALLNDPHLLVLDEPAQGVDITGQAELYQLITKIRTEHKCGILMVSHDLHVVMAGTDVVFCLNKHVCCSGHPETVQQHPEFLNLFGDKASSELAVYTHHHNHHHDIEGNIINND